jgi:hypothetical protein
MSYITIVAGFGRCGSSLVMQMLEAGGMPVTGNWPAFEDERCSVVNGRIDRDWLKTIPGHAIKVLDPQLIALPLDLSYRVIWCDRDHDEQAKSQIKFLATMCGFPLGRAERWQQIAVFADSYRRDKVPAVRALLALKPPGLLAVRFEDLLRKPKEMAKVIANYCGGLDIEKMASAVRQRSVLCAPDMTMETTLYLEREPVAA